MAYDPMRQAQENARRAQERSQQYGREATQRGVEQLRRASESSRRAQNYHSSQRERSGGGLLRFLIFVGLIALGAKLLGFF